MKDDINVNSDTNESATIEHLICLLVSSNKLLVDVNIEMFSF
jgi:hypothetical protein